MKNISIIGAGNGGITAAADLQDRGFDVTLYEMPSFKQNLEGIEKEGGIHFDDGQGSRFIQIKSVTTNIEKAVTGADFIMLIVPGFAIETFAQLIAPHATADQPILINGAGAMGSLRFVNEAQKMGIRTSFLIGETNSLTYGTRAFPAEARVELSLRVKKLFLAAYPKANTAALLEASSQLFDCFVAAENIWHTTLENGNPEVHPGPSLLNAGRIDYSGGEFWLYKEGITKHSVKLLQAVEKERLAIGKAFGFELENAIESRQNRGYFKKEDQDLQTLFNTSEVFTQIKGPYSVNSRYFTEDISSGLVLWSDLGTIAGVPTPNIDAIITIGGSILDTDFMEEGLTLEKLQINQQSVSELVDAV